MEDMILVHHGVEGQKWGNRKYQYEDGSLTPLGREHYGVGDPRSKSEYKIKEYKAKAKAEAKIIKAKAKAEAYKAKIKLKTYKEQKKADNEVELEKIRAQREIEKNISKENKEIARMEQKTNLEIAETGKNNGSSEKVKTALKITGAVLAVAGISYLAYRAVKNKGNVDGVDKNSEAKGAEIIKSFSNKPASEVANTTEKLSRAARRQQKQAQKALDMAAKGTQKHKEKVEKAISKSIKASNKALLKRGSYEMAFEKADRARQIKEIARQDKAVKKAIKSTKIANERYGSNIEDYIDKLRRVGSLKHGLILCRIRKRRNNCDMKNKDVILVHSSEYDSGLVICHYGVKGQKWGVIREKDDSEVKGRTKNIEGEVEGAKKKKKDATSQYLKSQPQQKYYSTGHPIAKPNYKIEWAGYSRDEDPAYAKYGISYGYNGKEGPKTKKEYINFMENEVNELVRRADKVGYYQTAYTLSQYIERYAAKKAIRLSSGEKVTYQDIQEVYAKAYDSILKAYQEEQRYLRDERKRKEKLKESLKKKQELSKQLKKAKESEERRKLESKRLYDTEQYKQVNKPKMNTKDLKRTNKVKHSSSDDMILCHHGIKGQKWGVRRWQYEDGTLTPEGKIHYGKLGERHDSPYKSKGSLKDTLDRIRDWEDKKVYNYKEKRYNKLNKQMSKEATKAEKAINKGKDPRKHLEKALTNAELMENEKSLNDYGIGTFRMFANYTGTTEWNVGVKEVAEYGKYAKSVTQKYKDMSTKDLTKMFNDKLIKTEKVKKVYNREQPKLVEDPDKTEYVQLIGGGVVKTRNADGSPVTTRESDKDDEKKSKK